MKLCLYCRSDASEAVGLAHVLPEGFVSNDRVLPLGTVCDGCNGHLGRRLDQTFVKHPAVSLMIQFLGLPGKSGKPRAKLGVVERDEARRVIYLPVSNSKPEESVDLGPRISVAPDATFDFRRFRRALHHIALNAYAYANGIHHALDQRFDAVRNYVRSPRAREAWPFVQYVDPTQPFELEGAVRFEQFGTGFFAGIILSPGLAFGVDLFNSGSISDWAPRQFTRGFQLYSSMDHVPPGPKIKGKVRNRVAIEF